MWRQRLSPRWMRLALNLWPPYFGAGIRILDISDDWRSARVRLRRGWLNTNYAGTQFGGSMFAMTDGLYVIMLSSVLEGRFRVWDRRASIEFVKPGRSDLFADFQVDEALVELIHTKTRDGAKFEPTFEVPIRDADGELVARVEKTIYIRPR